MDESIKRLRGEGPYYVAQCWGPQPESYVGATTSAARAKAALRGFARAQREQGYYSASGYRMLRCADKAAADRAYHSNIGSTPAGCEHVVEADL